jgi:hypothetical protein
VQLLLLQGIEEDRNKVSGGKKERKYKNELKRSIKRTRKRNYSFQKEKLECKVYCETASIFFVCF